MNDLCIPESILMTADTVGGVWTYSIELSRLLARTGISVALAAMGGPLSEGQRKEAEGIRGLKVHESPFKLEWMEDPWDDVESSGRWLLELEEKLRPGLIHLNGYSHAPLPFKAPKLVVAHSCVLSWWAAVKGGGLPPKWFPYRDRVAQGLKAASFIIAPTRAMFETLRQNYALDIEGAVIPNGLDPDAFHPGKKEPFIFSAGRLWDEAKNIGALKDIAPALSWPVYAAGDYDHPCGSLPAAGRMIFLGRLKSKEIAAWLSRASIYALPAYYEPFGLSVLEAGLSGSALVLGDIKSLREVWEDAAVFVPPGDRGALKEAIGGLISDNKRLKLFAGKARQRALSFTSERMLRGYIKVYSALAGCRT